ncbi:hypothetical protein Leryth_018241, partial [Lithospermum erythrorhizon]
YLTLYRFQILRDLIPENDQKRDKATFLLEVIQYIRFLKEKVEVYEGTYQGRSPELSKLMSSRSYHHPVESFVEQSPLSRNDFNEDDNVAVSPTLLSNVQNSVESCLSDESVYKLMDHHDSSVDHAIAANMPLQPNMFVDTSLQPHESFPVAENLNEHSGFSYVPSKWTTEYTTNSCTSKDLQNIRSNSGEPSISNAYSERLVNTLTRALQSSGVDLSQANISVQLDVGKQKNPRSIIATCSTNDQPGVQPMVRYGTSSEKYDHSNKRPRTQDS